MPALTEPPLPPRPGVAAARWEAVPDGWRLVLEGDLRLGRGGGPAWPADPVPLVAARRLLLDGSALQHWDASLAARLWAAGRRWRDAGAVIDAGALPAGLRHLLELAGSQAARARLDDEGEAAVRSASLRQTVAFLGEVLIAAARGLRGPDRPRAAEVLRQLDETGPRSVGIVLLTCALTGLMLAYMGGAQLGRIGAQNFLADVVTVGMVRELAGMMTAIILAGRIGSAFAAQLATMKAGEEIDALRALGVDPVTHLVLPRLVALLAVGPGLYVLGALAGVLAGWPAATLAYGVTTAEYVQQSLRAVTATHLWIGLFKCQVYMALVALAGCSEGLAAGRSAEAVGRATTAAVVKALVWIVAAATLTTVVFTSLGY